MAIKFSGGISRAEEVPAFPTRPGKDSHRSLAAPVALPLSNGRRFQGAFSLRDARHNFIVEILPKPAWNKPRPYLYTCARCKWAFRVNDSAGSIVALDGKGEPMLGSEAVRRSATFAEGPCGAFPAYALEQPAHVVNESWLRRAFVALFSRDRADAAADSRRPDLKASAS